MARGLADAVATTFSARGEAFERSALFDVDCFHSQFIDISAIVMFCICDSRLKHFLDNHSRFFLRKL